MRIGGDGNAERVNQTDRTSGRDDDEEVRVERVDKDRICPIIVAGGKSGCLATGRLLVHS